MCGFFALGAVRCGLCDVCKLLSDVCVVRAVFVCCAGCVHMVRCGCREPYGYVVHFVLCALSRLGAMCALWWLHALCVCCLCSAS